ncbi:MAG: glycosyltransferase [Candidatus Eremiobacteraeota bacterium]|nr:glycosyltransferase [Candidatus Eremiobacteraeota bacterium]
MNALRVGLFTECYRPIQNGIVASIDALAEVLREHRHDATVVTPNMPGYDDRDSRVVRVPSLPLPTATAYRLTVPYLPAQRAFSIVHVHSPFVTGWLGAREARRTCVPLVFTYHTQLEEYAHYFPFEERATRAAATRLTRTFANAADLVIVPTEPMERRLRSFGVRSRIAIVPSGIDVAQFACGRRSEALRARFGIARDEKMIVTVGRLGREKNVELALEAFASLADVRATFVIVGDGPHRESLERSAQQLGVADRTVFAREFPREALPDAYASSDAFVFASASETQGLVLVEALAAGASIVAVDTPQTRDVLGGAGRIARADATSIAEALRAVLAGPSNADAAKSVARRFERRDLGERVIDLYRSLIPAAASGIAGIPAAAGCPALTSNVCSMYACVTMAERDDRTVRIAVGFAVSHRGSGVVYALRTEPGGAESLVRVSFRCRPLAALGGRDVAYAALDALGREVRRRGDDRVDFDIADAELGLDLSGRRVLPAALTMPYVRLRCTLNRFRMARIAAVERTTIRDLTARARAESSLDIAA